MAALGLLGSPGGAEISSHSPYDVGQQILPLMPDEHSDCHQITPAMNLACKPDGDAAGGDDDEKQHSQLLENLTREQTKLGNMKPGQRFSLGDANKNISIKAFLPTAGATKVFP